MKRQSQHRNPYTRLGLTSNASRKDAERTHAELVNFLEGAPEGVRRWARDEITAVDAAYATLSNPASARRARRASPLKRAAIGIATLAVAVGVVIAVYDSGGDSGKRQSGAAETSEPALSPGDEFRVAKLMKKLKAEPNDIDTLVRLGNIFFAARDFNSAGAWMERAVKLDPENVKARSALGASEFNLGDTGDARHDWLRVIDLDPENVEAYYDLGFLYISQDPPNMAEAKKMWGKVVELAPGSSVAKSVSTHLKGLEEAASTGSKPPGGKG